MSAKSNQHVSSSQTSFIRPNTFTRDGGLKIKRYFSKEGIHPFDEVEWELRSAGITDEKGKVIFEQKDVEVPKTWSQTATNIVVSKYFHGVMGTEQRERSVKQLIRRVADTIDARRSSRFPGQNRETAPPGRGHRSLVGGPVAEGESLVQRAPGLRQPAAQEPVPGQGAGHPERGGSVVVLDRGAERASQVGGLGIQASEPGPLVVTAKA